MATQQAPLSPAGPVSNVVPRTPLDAQHFPLNAQRSPLNAQRSPPERQHALLYHHIALDVPELSPPLRDISGHPMSSFVWKVGGIGAIGVTAVFLAWLLACGSTLATLQCTVPRGGIPLPPPEVPLHITKYVDDKLAQTTAAIFSRISRGLVPHRDFALAADGGEVVFGLTSASKRGLKRTDGPHQVLNEDMRVGSCWRIPDAVGQVGISIPVTILPTNLTIDHIPKEIASDIGQAPREMVLWGVMDGSANAERYDEHFAALWPVARVHQRSTPPLTMGQRFIPVAKIKYNIHGTLPFQTFPVHQEVLASGLDFGVFVLEVLNNWGSDSTCLYRVRLHGTAH